MGSDDKKHTVILNGMLIDGTGNPATENSAIVIRGNRIDSVGPLPENVRLEDRDNVVVIDAGGQVVMPGLIDAHCHLSLRQPNLPGVKWPNNAEFCTIWAARNASKVLRAGVTSISVPGGKWFADVAVRNAVEAGLIEGPRIFCAGRYLNTAGSLHDVYPPWAGAPEDSAGVMTYTIDQMTAEVRRQCHNGVDFIKIGDSGTGDYQAFAKEELSAIVQEAHRRNAKVAIHSRGAGSTRAAAEAGVDWIVHADLATEEDLEAVAEAGIPILPTLTMPSYMVEHGTEVGMSQRALDRMNRNLERCLRNMGLARKLGIRVLAGSDCGASPLTVPGECNLHEAEVLSRQVGYTPMEAIVAQTSGNAIAVGLEGEAGTIAPGKLADILILNADPLENITVLQDPRMISRIIKDGVQVDLDAPGPDLDTGDFERSVG